MFKKPFKVKSNTRLKGSDVKKFKLELLRHFPCLSEESIQSFIPSKEVIFVVKLIVHSGDVVTVHCVQKLPVTFETEGVTYPTVYMLWHFPDLLYTFTTYPQVFTVLSGGADLMLPGVVFGTEQVTIKSYGKLEKGDRVAVNLTNNKAPVAVGKTALSSFDMYMSAKRGKCVQILHYFGDTLSTYGSSMTMPELGPVSFEDDSTEVDEKLAQVTSNLNVDESPTDVEQVQETDQEIHAKEEVEPNTQVEEDVNDPTSDNTESMNDLLTYCFLKSLKLSLKKATFPILTNALYTQHILQACPPGKVLDLKKTKYKKLSNFLAEMEETGIIRLEMASKGVQALSSVRFDHDLLKSFQPSEGMGSDSNEKQKIIDGKFAAPEITEKYTVTACVLPLFSKYLHKKGESLTRDSIRKCVTDYVRVENLKCEQSKKFVKLDKTLRDIIGGDEEYVTWDILVNGVIKGMGHSYELGTGEQKTAFKGKLQPIDIQVGTRCGNKKVTLVSNLELYGINIAEFSKECQHGVAASTTINYPPGSKSAQVQIQGNQVIFVEKILTEKYSINKRHLRGLENAPKKKK